MESADIPTPPRTREARSTRRIVIIDIARGLAIVGMVVFHGAWDLEFLDLAPLDVVGDRAWRSFAVLIASSFLVIVGISLVLAHLDGVRPRPFLRRLGTIGGAALLVTLATFIAMPDRFIFFGILHCIALSTLLAVPFLRAPAWLAAAVAVAVAAVAYFVSAPLFDQPALLWVGLGTEPQETNDYVPVFPWFAAVLVGLVLGRLALHLRAREWWARIAPLHVPSRALAWCGRHSLPIYLLHQLFLFGSLWLLLQLTGPNAAAERAPIMQTCEASCRDTGGDTGQCRIVCRCAVEAVKRDGLWRPMMENRLTDEERAHMNFSTRQCRAAVMP